MACSRLSSLPTDRLTNRSGSAGLEEHLDPLAEQAAVGELQSRSPRQDRDGVSVVRLERRGRGEDDRQPSPARRDRRESDELARRHVPQRDGRRAHARRINGPLEGELRGDARRDARRSLSRIGGREPGLGREPGGEAHPRDRPRA